MTTSPRPRPSRRRSSSTARTSALPSASAATTRPSGDHKAAIELQDTILAADQNQIDPLLIKLWSYYAQLDAVNAVKTLDAVFKLIEPDNPLLPLLQSHAAFMRPLEGKGELAKVDGRQGHLRPADRSGPGAQAPGATVGGEYTRVLLLELREEARIHKALADQLKLKEIAKIKTFGSDTETSIVLIPEVKFGDLKITNIPAIVDDLSTFGLGETPGLLLGRQVLSKIGAITFDFPNASLELQSAAPTGAPRRRDRVAAAPARPPRVPRADCPGRPRRLRGQQFYAWLGGSYGTALTVAKKNYLKSGHLPRELDPLDDPNAGLKMVYIDQAKARRPRRQGRRRPRPRQHSARRRPRPGRRARRLRARRLHQRAPAQEHEGHLRPLAGPGVLRPEDPASK